MIFTLWKLTLSLNLKSKMKFINWGENQSFKNLIFLYWIRFFLICRSFPKNKEWSYHNDTMNKIWFSFISHNFSWIWKRKREKEKEREGESKREKWREIESERERERKIGERECERQNEKIGSVKSEWEMSGRKKSEKQE